MALLTDGAVANVLFASPVTAPWQALSPIPGWTPGSALGDAVSNGTALAIYVNDAASGQFSFLGGQTYGYDDTIITVSGVLTKVTTTGSGGSPVVWIKDGTDIYTLGSNGALELQNAGEMTALKAFLP